MSHIKWSEPRTIFFSLAAFYFVLFDFTANPLLSMPRDWDFLSLAAAPITFFSIVLVDHISIRVTDRKLLTSLAGFTLGLGAVSCTIFYVNANPEAASIRLRGSGIWVYHSYYKGSSYMINVGETMIDNIDKQIEDRERVIRELAPSAAKYDFELSFLHQKLGEVYYEEGDYGRAGRSFSNAYERDPSNFPALKDLAVTCLKTRRFPLASDLIDLYNRSVNDPEVNDPKGLTLSEYINYLRFLESSGQDSVSIQHAIDQVQLF